MAANRDALLAALQAALPAPVDSRSGFATERFLSTVAVGRAAPCPEQSDQLAALARKVELTGKLHQAYAAGPGRPASKVPVRPAYAVLLCGLCLERAQRCSDMVALNAALKMLDGQFTRPRLRCPSELRDWADELLDGIALVAAP